MKKITMIVCVLMVVFGAVGMGERAAALSVLTNTAGQKVVDDGAGHYWYWDMTYFTNQDYATQMQNIGNLDYFGSTQWHLAVLSEMQVLWGASALELLGSFKGTILNTGEEEIRGRYNAIATSGYHQTAYVTEHPRVDKLLGIGSGPPALEVYDKARWFVLGAWVVTASSAVIPEPTTLVLMGIGLIGLLALHRTSTK